MKKWKSWKDCVEQVKAPYDHCCQVIHGRGPDFTTDEGKEIALIQTQESIDMLVNVAIRYKCVWMILTTIGFALDNERTGNVTDEKPLRFNDFDDKGLPVFIEPVIYTITKDRSITVNPEWLAAGYQVEAFVPKKFKYTYDIEMDMHHDDGTWHHYYRMPDCGPETYPPELGIEVWYIERTK